MLIRSSVLFSHRENVSVVSILADENGRRGGAAPKFDPFPRF